MLAVFFPQNLSRLNHPLDFFESVLFIVDASFGKTAEAALSHKNKSVLRLIHACHSG